MTNVPAKMSPSRLPLTDSSDVISAGAPSSNQISSTDASARTSAWRNRSGPPSSPTTRRPMASLPRDRPRLTVSRIVG